MYRTGILHGNISTESVVIVADKSGGRRGRLINFDTCGMASHMLDSAANSVKTCCDGIREPDLGCSKESVPLGPSSATVPVKGAAWHRRFENWYKQYSGHPDYPENPHLTREAALRVYEASDDETTAGMFLMTLWTEFPDLLALKRPASLISLRLFSS